MKIKLIQVGKTKHQFVEQAVDEYLKRLKTTAKIEILTLKETKLNQDSSNPSLRHQAKKAEAEMILKSIEADSKLIVLDETGKQFNSIDFAKIIQTNLDFEGGNLTFVIGGAFGLDQQVLAKADLILSFSKFTFTHEMIRMLLWEQIYRAFSIVQNKTYHY